MDCLKRSDETSERVFSADGRMGPPVVLALFAVLWQSRVLGPSHFCQDDKVVAEHAQADRGIETLKPAIVAPGKP